MFVSKMKLKGTYEIVQENGKVLKFENQITEIFRTDLLKLFFAQSGTFTATSWHLALGAGTTPATPADTMLEDEIFRKQAATAPTFDNLHLRQVVLSAENITEFTEIGVFVNGTDTEDSGKMISRIVIPKYEKSATSELIIDWTLKVEI